MTPAEAAEFLETSGRAFTNLLTSLPRDAATWRPAPDEWCVNECAGHIIESEKRAFAGRIRIILGADEPALETWDQPGVARARHDCEREPKELGAELDAVRRESVSMLRSLEKDALGRGGVHPRVGRLTVDALIHQWVHHDSNHLRQAYANVQAYVWPKMGAAQRFSPG